MSTSSSLHTEKQVYAKVNAVTHLLLGGVTVPVLSCLQLGMSASFHCFTGEAFSPKHQERAPGVHAPESVGLKGGERGQ